MSATAAAPPNAGLRPEQIAARSGSSFLSGFLCLDRARRDGMTAIYAYCRVVDDAVDEAPDVATGRAHLGFWRAELAAAVAGTAGTPVGAAVQATMRAFGVAPECFEELLAGVAMDLEPKALGSEADLRLYCHRVASAVGLACLPVLGATAAGARNFAEALGQALQLTNIRRDLRADAQAGRVYVPATWLAEVGVEAAWLGGGAPDAVYAPGGPMARLCTRLEAAARAEFAAARAALRSLDPAQRHALVPARIMGAVYRDLLARLERRRGDLRGERVRVPKLRKMWLALTVFAGVRQ
ncbi:MAG TPA: squalene/phytoene synthase family protein [Planctomycetota bacterium]|nr:squalene/phytoene synthase family protein [Planctomycetota bacterium]